MWGQEQAFEESQKYKEGKFIIEKAKMTKVRHSQLLGRVVFSCSQTMRIVCGYTERWCDCATVAGRELVTQLTSPAAHVCIYPHRQRRWGDKPDSLFPLKHHSNPADQAETAHMHAVVA